MIVVKNGQTDGFLLMSKDKFGTAVISVAELVVVFCKFYPLDVQLYILLRTTLNLLLHLLHHGLHVHDTLLRNTERQRKKILRLFPNVAESQIADSSVCLLTTQGPGEDITDPISGPTNTKRKSFSG